MPKRLKKTENRHETSRVKKLFPTHLIHPQVLPRTFGDFVEFNAVQHENDGHENAKDENVFEVIVELQLHDVATKFQSTNGLNQRCEDPPADEGINLGENLKINATFINIVKADNILPLKQFHKDKKNQKFHKIYKNSNF